MVYYQQLLIELLSAAIFGKPEMVVVSQKVDWLALYKEALDHQVAPLIYNAVKYKIIGEMPSKEVLDLWQSSTIYNGMKQTILCENMKTVFVELNNYRIEYLPLKGLILRDLYPYKELRTMGDADILIHKEDFEKVAEILQNYGYRQLNNSGIHTSFIHEKWIPIEIHWALVYDKLFNRSDIFNNLVWENAIEASYYDIPIRTLSNEDMLIHLCIHMATHFIFAGFGLRQLCDFLLFIEKNKGCIKWEYFINETNELGINKFVFTMFDVCNQLFNLEVPDENLQHAIEKTKNDHATELLINEIFRSGVFGDKDANQVVKVAAIQYHKNASQKGKTSRKDFFMALLFPSAKIYTNKYNYARKYPFLTPVFWVHHFMNGVFRRGFLFNGKLFSVIKAPGDAQRKQELLEELGLL